MAPIWPAVLGEIVKTRFLSNAYRAFETLIHQTSFAEKLGKKQTVKFYTRKSQRAQTNAYVVPVDKNHFKNVQPLKVDLHSIRFGAFFLLHEKVCFSLIRIFIRPYQQ